MSTKETNKEAEGRVQAFFLSNNPTFISACEKAGIQPTKRQASKWLAKKGLAYKMGGR